MSVPQLEFSPLLDWVEGRLSPQAAQDMELLLAGADETTRETVTWLRHFLAAREAVRIASPPTETHNLLRERFAAYAAERRSPGLLQRVVAALSFDSTSQPLTALGTRTSGAMSFQHRQLVFSCAVADIALNLHRRPNDGHLDVSGQVFTHGQLTPAGWGVLLIGENGPDATHTDDLGEFAFEAISPGDYTISLETRQLAITMPMVALVP
jgi:hypothetical protein